MKILVVGSNGFMGSNLVRFLKQNGHCVETSSSCNQGGINPDTGMFPESFFVTEGTGCVVYLAQSPIVGQRQRISAHQLAVNVVSAVHCATKAIEARAKRFIYVSTGSVYAPTFLPLGENSPTARDNGYALSKLHGEEALSLLAYEIDLICVRPFGVYGPGQSGRLIPNLTTSISNGRPVMLNPKSGEDGTCEGLRLSLCHVDDASQALVHLAVHGGPGILNLAGDEAPSIRMIAEEIGRKLEIEPIYEIADRARTFDFVADVSLLRQTFDHQFLSFREGVSTL